MKVPRDGKFFSFNHFKYFVKKELKPRFPDEAYDIKIKLAAIYTVLAAYIFHKVASSRINFREIDHDKNMEAVIFQGGKTGKMYTFENFKFVKVVDYRQEDLDEKARENKWVSRNELGDKAM